MNNAEITCKDVVCSIFAKRIGERLSPEYIREECNRITRMLGIPKFNDPDRLARGLCNEGWLDKDSNGHKILPLARGLQGKSFRNVYELCRRTLDNSPRQIIYYGAPGTGKSWRIDEMTDESNRIRTTFHPDSDYSTFVGAYKPTADCKPTIIKTEKVEISKPESITYKFVPQVFLKAYCRAWRRWAEGNQEPYYLVIEEINRGNCAQIFGDLFQLLDRSGSGFSSYAIESDDDIRRFISEDADETLRLGGCTIADVTRADGKVIAKGTDIANGSKLVLPPNFYIWATMNTSDQSLFPIDSAFKRRWDMTYVPIANAEKGWRISVGDAEYDWWSFVEKVNAHILETTRSEDKQLGYFFVAADASGKISVKQFVNKVLFYLYNDAFKDYDLPDKIFGSGEHRLTFRNFFGGIDEVKEDVVKQLFETMGLAKIEDENPPETEVVAPEAETPPAPQQAEETNPPQDE